MLSACVVTYARPDVLEACLRRVRFADEVVVIDRSSPGPETERVACAFADVYHLVPWGPVVEEIRSYAVGLCSNPWVITLDDDEILSPHCATLFPDLVASDPNFDVLWVPIRHRLLGKHDPRAWYHPDYRPTLARAGAVCYRIKVHDGVTVSDDLRSVQLSPGGDAFIDHLSCSDVASYIDKMNRYTSFPDRAGVAVEVRSPMATAVRCLEHWRGRVTDGDSYLEAVAVLKAVYEIVDGLKRWEVTQPSGYEAFREVCEAVCQN